MKSLKELFRIGQGPSSSHTMGPRFAAEQYLSEHPNAICFRATLYGSLAATGKGHLTDIAIRQVLGDRCEIIWKPEIKPDFHPNGMKFECIIGEKPPQKSWGTIYSVASPSKSKTFLGTNG